MVTAWPEFDGLGALLIVMVEAEFMISTNEFDEPP
jgi:hypothetical protein